MGNFTSSRIPECTTSIPKEPGVYRTTQTLTYPKIIMCQRKQSSDKPTRPESVLAQVEIPAGATVVRPSVSNSWGGTVGKLRTSDYRLKSINGSTTMPERFVGCQSWLFDTFAYQVGQTYTSKLNTDLNDTCTDGLHFFETEAQAKQFGGLE